MKRLNPNHYYPQMSQMNTDANPERLRPAAGRGERLAFLHLRKSATSVDNNNSVFSVDLRDSVRSVVKKFRLLRVFFA